MEPDGAALADSCRAIAKILAAMKPADAAKILAHLSDDQVEGILRASGVRQAGILLAQLTPERGAAMSRRLIIRREGKKP
jgi:flagellar motility protein MotE (MotC chaperone)